MPQAPTLCTIATLVAGDWIRLPTGEVGFVRDKVHHPGYSKACITLPGDRQPIRILRMTDLVEHLPNHTS